MEEGSRGVTVAVSTATCKTGGSACGILSNLMEL